MAARKRKAAATGRSHNCGAKTLDGTLCKRKTHNKRCAQHRGKK